MSWLPTNGKFVSNQHACDEIRNFERLCRDTVLHEQKLIAPLSLKGRLSSDEQDRIVEREDVFHQNGFRFASFENGELALVALPHSGS